MCKRLKGFLTGGIVFGAIGTALGLLFAPRKGKELRKKLLDEHSKGGDLKNVIKNDLKLMGQDLHHTAKQLKKSETVVDIAQKTRKKGKEILSSTYEKLKDLSVKAGDTFDEFVSGDFDMPDFRQGVNETGSVIKEKSKTIFDKAKKVVSKKEKNTEKKF